MRRAIAFALLALLAVGVATYAAGEQTEVVVIRALDARFREKYGWVDAWYGLLLRHDPVPIRLRAQAHP